MKIIPSIIAKNQKKLDERIKKVKDHFSLFQLDIVDGKFVENKRSFTFDFKLPKSKYEAHLMVKNPQIWVSDRLAKNLKYISIIIFSLHGCKDVDQAIDLIRSKKKKVGISINPETPISQIEGYLKKIDQVTVMTVHPGMYGAKFLPKVLKKVKDLRRLKPRLNIEVDGGVSPDTIKRIKIAGASKVVVGSYLQKADDIKKAADILKKRMKDEQ